MANRLSNRGMAKSDGHIARKERQMFGRRVADTIRVERPDRCLQVYKLILDLTDGVSWPLSLQAAWLSSPA